MKYNELIQLYFERSNALQGYWTLYVVVLGGLLAFSSLRKQPAMLTTALVVILFAIFAYKNLDAIQEVTTQRLAVMQSMKAAEVAGSDSKGLRDLLEPTLNPASLSSVRTTHIVSDLLAIAALCAMEMRRRKFREMAV